MRFLGENIMRDTGSSLARKVVQLGRKSLGFALVFAACGGTAWAREAPEIDPGSATSAVALLLGGMLLLLARKQPAQEAVSVK
jgi:hypothetical protein